MTTRAERPGVADIVAAELKEVRTTVTALENAVGQDDHVEVWEEATWTVGDLERAVETLSERIRTETRKREDMEDCPECEGSGRKFEGSVGDECPACDGTGKKR